MIKVGRNLLTIMLAVGTTFPLVHAAELSNQPQAVFVMTNAADRNEIIAYEHTSDGGFYEKERYATGGRGSGGVTDPLESQGSLTLNQTHSYLFAVNAGSGTISVFRVHGTWLSLVDKSPSGGSEPVAVTQWGDRVYVLNAGGSGSVVAFRLGHEGHLRQIDQSTMFLSANATGGASLTVSPDGQFLAVTERLANTIDIFPIHADGTLGPIVVNHSSSPGVFSALFAPDGKLIVSETGPAGAVNGSAISSYSILPNGTLAAVSQSIPTYGAANCWNVITQDGKFVYVSNAGSASISGFVIGQGGSLSPIGGAVVGTNPAGSTNLDIAISGDQRYLYSLNSGSGTIGVFEIRSDGTLNSLGEIQGLPKSAGFNGIAAL